jgi:predicted unusual protein kinase regulating ubiquinone biosynthesis (AarF/ABC1/UbiB family)
VVVKVQRPGSRELVLRDLGTLHTFAKLVGKDISWDVDMVMTEVMSRVKGEFDFEGEAAVQVVTESRLYFQHGPTKPPPLVLAFVALL